MKIQEILDFNESKRIAISPEMAAIMLQGNHKYNRRLSMKKVSLYSKAMRNGLWNKYDTNAIGFTPEFELVNGQHRLQAIINSGCTITIRVENDIDKSAFDIIDTGKSRNSSDVFHMNGIENSSKISNFISKLYNLNMKRSLKRGSDSENLIYTPKCLFKYYEHCQEAINKVNLKTKIPFIPNSICYGVQAYLFQFEDHELVQEFFIRLEIGSGLKDGSPILALRNNFIKMKFDNIKRNNNEVAGKILKSFYAFRDNKEIKIVRFSENGKEKYPYHKNHKLKDFYFECN